MNTERRGALKVLAAGIMAIVILREETLAQNANGKGGDSAGEKGGGNGSAGGRGNSGGKGNGSGKGNVNGNSDGGANDGSNSSSRGNGSAGTSSQTGNPSGSSSQSVTRATEGTDGSITIRHRNGITETLASGRYIMKDARGRTIVNRRAIATDAGRLRKFSR